MIRSPLLWSGSKFDLLPHILPMIRGRCWEPFCGSAVVSLNYQGEAIISDRNAELMNFWAQVKSATDIIPAIWENDENTFYHQRYAFNRHAGLNSSEQARRFLYLNRTCWRGLYRENSKGEFNVPWGARKRVEWPTMPDMSRITVDDGRRNYSEFPPNPFYPRDVKVDTIYCDPPYHGKSHTYGVKFDHERFAAWCHTRPERVLVSNSPTAVDLFPGWHVTEVSAKGGIGKRRQEVILWNGK